MTAQFRPLPDDPGAAEIESMIDLNAPDWILATHGDYQSCAGIAFRSDGSNPQEVVLLEWPGRLNHTDQEHTVRIAMSPEDAIGLAEILAHSGGYMVDRRARS